RSGQVTITRTSVILSGGRPCGERAPGPESSAAEVIDIRKPCLRHAPSCLTSDRPRAAAPASPRKPRRPARLESEDGLSMLPPGEGFYTGRGKKRSAGSVP